MRNCKTPGTKNCKLSPMIVRVQQTDLPFPNAFIDFDTDASNLSLPTSSFPRKETPPPPSGPVRGRRREGSLVSDSDRIPVAVDQFDAGKLEDDWFADDGGKDALAQLSERVPVNADSDNEESGNPMVAGDEDVSSVEYYQQDKNVATALSPTTSRPPEATESEEEEEEAPAPVYKSELADVWAATGARSEAGVVNSAKIESESEDEDNMFREHSGFEGFGPASAFSSGAFGGYEEIGGGGSNPWSWGASHRDDNTFADITNDAPYGDVDEKDDERVDSVNITYLDCLATF